jgi:hypothetical protein
MGLKCKKMRGKKTRNTDQLSQIYGEMNETGKEKLSRVSAQILNIWNTVHEEKSVSSDTVMDVDLGNKIPG